MDASTTFQLVSTLAAVLGLAFVAFQIRQARSEAREAESARERESSRLRRQATLEYARQTLDFRHTTWSTLPDDFNAEEVKDSISHGISGEDEKLLAAVLEYLGSLETLCIGVSEGIYDLRTTHQLYGSRIIAVSRNYRDLIDWRRKSTGRESLFSGLEEVAAKFMKFRAGEAEPHNLSIS
jgi:hypothetical protein